MRSYKDIYRKLKEVKFKHLVLLYRHHSRRMPENCRYNCRYVFTDRDGNEQVLRLCLLNQHYIDTLNKGIFPQLVDVCQQPEHSTNCSEWIQRLTKEEIQQIFKQELETPQIKNQKYPDIAALEWVLERTALEIPPLSWLGVAWYYIKKLCSPEVV